jgi:hypothetical protein
MKHTLKSAVTVAALVAAAGGAVLLTAGAAQAATPPWVGSDPNEVGGLEFFNAAGQQITGGTLSDTPFTAYIVGTTAVRATGDVKATLYGYLPNPSAAPGAWSGETLSASTVYPNATAHAPVNSTTLPVVTEDTNETNLAGLASDFPQNSTTAGYVNTYELRLRTSGGTSPGVSQQYDFADITVDTSANTWTVAYSPAQVGTPTTSTLGSSASSVNVGSTVNLTDTISPAAAPGTVQFSDNGAPIGSPVAVSGGVAATTAAIPNTGANAITAVYTPTALSGYSGSTSNTVTVTGNVVVANTTTALAANPTTAAAFTPVVLTATVSPSAAAGTVKFFDAGAQIGVAAVSGGTASFTYSGFAQGDHPTVTASFVPASGSNYSASTSAAIDFVATAPTGALPDVQSIEADVAPGSLAITTPYTAANPLNLGTLALNSAGTLLSANAPFGDGSIATYPSSGPNGTGSIQIVDTKAGNANWTASVLASPLTDAGSDAISAENLGLTGLTAVPLGGNAQTAANLHVTNLPAATGVAPGDTGSAGLGGSTAHAFANTINGGDGTIGVKGTLTLNAPTSTVAGHYTGTVTFTVV